MQEFSWKFLSRKGGYELMGASAKGRPFWDSRGSSLPQGTRRTQRTTSFSLCFPVSPVVQALDLFITKEPIEDHKEFPSLVLNMDVEENLASPAIVPTPRINQVSAAIVNSAMRVHSLLGPG